MGNWIQVACDDGFQMQAWHARPQGQAKAGVVLVQEIFGVNEHIRSVAQRLADAGFEVIAPSLFDRWLPQVELGYGAEGIERGVALMKQASPDTAARDVQAAAAALGQGLPRSVMGFCWGGLVAWLAAARSDTLSAAVCYYPGGIDQAVGEVPKRAVLVHLAEQDDHIPVSVGGQLTKAYPSQVTVHTYPAMHGFNCDVRGSHEPRSAALAWERSLRFLDQHAAMKGPAA